MRKNFGTTKKSHFRNIVFQSTKLGINNGYLTLQNIIFHSRKSKCKRREKWRAKEPAEVAVAVAVENGVNDKSEIS